MKKLSKVFFLHVILALLLVWGWQYGFTQVVIDADRMAALPVIGTLTALAILFVCLNRNTDALWLGGNLPVFGLGFTVVGILWAMKNGMDGEQFKIDFVHSLVGNLLGIMGYFWTELNVKVTDE